VTRIAQYLGIDQRQRDGVCGRRGLLSGVQRYDIGGQCGQRSPIHQVIGSNHIEKRLGHQAVARNPQRPRRHI